MSIRFSSMACCFVFLFLECVSPNEIEGKERPELRDESRVIESKVEHQSRSALSHDPKSKELLEFAKTHPWESSDCLTLFCKIRLRYAHISSKNIAGSGSTVSVQFTDIKSQETRSIILHPQHAAMPSMWVVSRAAKHGEFIGKAIVVLRLRKAHASSKRSDDKPDKSVEDMKKDIDSFFSKPETRSIPETISGDVPFVVETVWGGLTGNGLQFTVWLGGKRARRK